MIKISHINQSLPYILVLLIGTNLQLAQAKTFSLGLEQASKFTDAQIVDAPKPEIPSAMHENCFKSCCIARFMIDPKGKTDVKLLTTSGSPDVDDITISTLQHWKFRPATLNGEPIASTRRVRVEFDVE